MLSINYKDARPIYEQVRDSMRALILSGAIAPGEKLPSVRELASQLAINPNTIQRAYRELERLGLICTVPGKGAFASEDDAGARMRREELLGEIESRTRELRRLGCDEDALKDIVARVYREEDPT